MKFRGGVVGTVQSFFGCDDPDQFQILGTRGTIVASPLNGDTLTVTINGSTTQELLPPNDNFAVPMIEDFVGAVRGSRPPRVDGIEGRRTTVAMDAAYAEAKSGAARGGRAK